MLGAGRARSAWDAVDRHEAFGPKAKSRAMGYATYGYLGVSGLVTGSLALYILLTGHGSLFDVGYFLESISPVYWATMGASAGAPPG